MASEFQILTFNWETYYDTHKEIIIKDLEITTKNRDIAWHHWNNFGKNKRLRYFELDAPAKIPSLNPYDSDAEYILFNHESYIMLYSDLESVIKTKEEGWNHWIKYGKNEGRIWNVSENWKVYVNNYDDLRDSVKTQNDAWDHWINYGKKEGRKWKMIETDISEKVKEINLEIENLKQSEDDFEDLNWDNLESDEKIENAEESQDLEWGNVVIVNEYDEFNWEIYKNNYSDLSHFTHKIDAWKHWINNGKEEGRTFAKIENCSKSTTSQNTNITKDSEYDNFDWEKYVNKYDDLKLISSKDSAWSHWINHGKKEMRTYFSIVDLNMKKKEDYFNKIPHNHWIHYENSFNKNYNDFDWETYISNYDDMGEMNSREDAWEHWIFHGISEGRTTINLTELDENINKIMTIESAFTDKTLNIIDIKNEEVKEEKEEE